MTETTLISDRQPTKADGNPDGEVLMMTRPGQHENTVQVHWSHVGPCIQWRHCDNWRPLTQLPGINGQWINGAKVLPTVEYATDNCYVEVRNSEGWVTLLPWLHVREHHVWRPHHTKDGRFLELAPKLNRPPGVRYQWISGSVDLPTREEGDHDGELLVKTADGEAYRAWEEVKYFDQWKPRPPFDKRPIS
jgi:hypothetical protein